MEGKVHLNMIGRNVALFISGFLIDYASTVIKTRAAGKACFAFQYKKEDSFHI